MRIVLIAILICLFQLGGFSQQGQWVEIRDFETWTSAGIKLKLDKSWEFGLSEQLRLKENSSVVDVYFTELEIKYKGFKRIEIGGGLRYIKENDNVGKIQGYENHFRFNLDLAYKHKWDRFTFKHRLRYQNKNELGISESEGDYMNHHFRLKTGVNYNIKNWKFDPKFSAEIFHHQEQKVENGFDKWRVTLGTSYDLKKYGEIDLLYRMEKQLNTPYPKTFNIVGLSYVYTFKIKTK